MVRRALLLIVAVFSAAMAVAQDAPPGQLPDAGTRPPARPDAPSADPVSTDPAPSERPAPQPATSPAPVPAKGTPAEGVKGDTVDGSADDLPDVPTGPPAWQALTEDEFSYQSCLLGLSLLGVSYTQLDPITSPEDRDCGIARPLNITRIQPGISIAGGATMRCDTARRLALWLRNDAAPALRHLSGAPGIVEILPGSTYQCRARVGGSDDKLSEHALGNAFDVSALRLSDGSELTVSPRDGTGDIHEAVQKAIRYAACLQFTTVLGPGSNAAHDDHLHFDIADRKGGWRLCE